MHAKFVRFMPYPGEDAFEGLLSTTEQLNDPELQDLFGPIPTDEPAVADPAPADPAATPAATPDPAPATPPQDPAQAPIPPEGAPTPTQAPETPQQPPQAAPEVVDPADPRPDIPEIEVPEFETREEWQEWARTQEKRRRDLQSWTDRQLDKANRGSQAAERQLQQLNQQQLAMQQQVASLTQHALQPQQAPQQITQEDIIESVKTRPDDAVEWLRLNVPDAVDYAITVARQVHGDAYGNKLQREVITNNLRDEQSVRDQAAQMERAPEIVRAGFQQVINNVRQKVGAERFDAVSDRVSTLCVENLHMLQDPQRNPHGVTPDAVREYVRDQYDTAREEQFARTAAQPQQPRTLPVAETVPVGSAGPGGTPPAADTGEALVDEMESFQASRQTSWD